MGCTIQRWTATAEGSGFDRVIKVKGEGECTHSGYVVELVPTNEGPRNDPELLALRLEVEELEEGAEVITPLQVVAEVRSDPAVRIRIDTAEGPIGLDIAEVVES